MTNNKLPMSWVSHEMMRERTSGPYANYGEMLYAESMESSLLRRQKVGAARGGEGGRLGAGLGGGGRARASWRAGASRALGAGQSGRGRARATRALGSVASSGSDFAPSGKSTATAHALASRPAPRQAERQRAEQYAAEMASATFSPEITRMAQQMRAREDDAAVPAWERLSQSGRRGEGAAPRRAAPSAAPASPRFRFQQPACLQFPARPPSPTPT